MNNQNYINHIALVLDASSSMQTIAADLIKVADEQIKYLAKRSVELGQETRVTVYVFSDYVKCVFYDKDVLRLPSIKDVYKTDGMTALVDASIKSIEDLKKTPELYGDHAFLVYVITDGLENRSNRSRSELSKLIGGLPDNWTVACFVPNAAGKTHAESYAFPPGNVQIWETTSEGLKDAGRTIASTTETYMTNRSSGVRGYKNLFNMNHVSKDDVKNLTKLHPGQYRTIEVKDKVNISTLVENITGRPYKMGEAYYQLSKPEKLQESKSIVIVEKKGRSAYVGSNARKILGLPDHEVRVAPVSHPDFDIFVQSRSVNRNLLPGTFVLLMS
jgi:hypothetical protein